MAKKSEPGKGSKKDETKVKVFVVDSEKEQGKKRSKKVAKRKKAEEKTKKRHLPKPIKVVLKPFFAIGRYLRDSWRELSEVRWTTRRATWKMTFAVVAYTAVFLIFIALLDMLFTFIFNKILG